MQVTNCVNPISRNVSNNVHHSTSVPIVVPYTIRMQFCQINGFGTNHNRDSTLLDYREKARRNVGYLVHVEVFNCGVEAGIQVIQKIHHLENKPRGGNPNTHAYTLNPYNYNINKTIVSTETRTCDHAIRNPQISHNIWAFKQDFALRNICGVKPVDNSKPSAVFI